MFHLLLAFTCFAFAIAGLMVMTGGVLASSQILFAALAAISLGACTSEMLMRLKD